MKTGKRILSLLLALVLVLALAPSAWAASFTANEVAEYFLSLVGSDYPSGYCLSFVADGFEALGAPRDSACCAYTYGSSRIVSASMADIPVGADVFFTGSGSTCTKGCGNRCGHIGVYVGDGYMVHAMSGKVRKDKVAAIDAYDNLAYRGWGYHGKVTISGGSPAPREQDTRFSGFLPLKTYALQGSGRLPVYTSGGAQEAGRWIDAAADECIIRAVYADGWCQAQYPSSSASSGYRTAYVPLSVFTSASGFGAVTATGSGPAYRRSSGSDAIGSVDVGDACRKVGEADGRWQIIYPAPGGHKMGWCDPKLFGSVSPTAAETALGVPCRAYAIGTGRLQVYSAVNGSAYPTSGSGAHYIDGGADLCTIHEFYANGWSKVSYPTGSGSFTAYAPTSYFIPGSARPISWTADARRNTYRRSTGTEYVAASGVSYVSAGDRCIQTAAENGRIQIEYPLDGGGYKLGWVETAEKTAPLISNIQVSGVSASGYTVSCTVTDDSGVREVRFPTWTVKNDQDDIQPDWEHAASALGTRNGNTWTYRVSVSGHNNESGTYMTHIYAYDIYGNARCEGTAVQVPAPDAEAPVISDVRISEVSREGFTVTCTAADNVGVTKVLFPAWTDKDGQDDLFQPWTTHPANEGRRSGSTWTFRVHTSAHNDESGLYHVHIYAYDAAGNSRKAETTVTVPVEVTYISLSAESLTLTVGETGTLTAVLEPGDAADRSVTWTSSSPAAATVSGGTVSAVGAGTAYITAGTANGLTAVCTVTVLPASVEGGTIAVGSVTGQAGELVSVPVTISGNPGVAAARLQLSWDTDAMSLFDVQDGGLLGDYTFSQDLRAPYTVLWSNGASPADFTGEGTLMTLTFFLRSAAAAGDYAVSVSARPEEICNRDLTPVGFTLQSGTVTVAAAPELPEVPALTAEAAVSSASAPAGGTVRLQVSLGDNPGVAYLSFRVSYDETRLRLIGYEDAALTGWTGDPEGSCGFGWDDVKNSTVNGGVLTLIFAVPETAPAGEAFVRLTSLSAFDLEENEIEVRTAEGCVEVTDRVPGDVTGDGAVNGQDVVRLRKHLIGMCVPADLSNGDVTGDGRVNGQDLLRLRKHLLGMDAVLLEETAGAPVAQTGSLTLTVPETVARGESFQVPVCLSGGAGVAYLSFHVSYDETRLRLTGCEDGALTGWTTDIGGSNGFEWDDLRETEAGGSLLVLRFLALEDAPEGAADIRLTGAEAFGLEENAVALTAEPAAAAVLSASPAPGTHTVTVSFGGREIALTAEAELRGSILAAGYTAEGRLVSVRIYPAAARVEAEAMEGADHVRFMWLDSGCAPLCEAAELPLNG